MEPETPASADVSPSAAASSVEGPYIPASQNLAEITVKAIFR